MNRTLECLALAACVVFGGNVHGAAVKPKKPVPMTKAQYEAEKAKIATELQVDRKLCDGIQGQRGKICQTEAKARAQALKAELEARYRPSPEAAQKAKNATAEANYDVAKAKCAALAGKAGDLCLQEAKAAREAAIRQAKVEKVQETGGPFAAASTRRVAKGPDS